MKMQIVIIWLFFPVLVSGQITSINAPFNEVKVDHLGNVYLLENNQLSKYAQSGKFLYSYNHNNRGTIASFDVTDPLKILIYDQEYNQLHFLNAQLAPISDGISIDDLGIPLSEIACKSAKEGYWIFDASSRELKYFNSTNQLIHKSIKIDQIITYNAPPKLLLERNNQLFLHFISYGILVFDNFGAYIKKIHIPNVENLQVTSNELVYFLHDTIFRYNYQLHQLSAKEFKTTEKVQNIFLQNERAYIIKHHKVEIQEMSD